MKHSSTAFLTGKIGRLPRRLVHSHIAFQPIHLLQNARMSTTAGSSCVSAEVFPDCSSDLLLAVAGMASLPPSMLNMGWEYPAHLLQGPDPLPPSRHRAARGDASQQPNNAVSTSHKQLS